MTAHSAAFSVVGARVSGAVPSGALLRDGSTSDPPAIRFAIDQIPPDIVEVVVAVGVCGAEPFLTNLRAAVQLGDENVLLPEPAEDQRDEAFVIARLIRGDAWTLHTVGRGYSRRELLDRWGKADTAPRPSTAARAQFDDPDVPEWDRAALPLESANRPKVGGWGVAILLLGLVGAAIGYFATRSSDRRRANHILKWGLIWTLPLAVLCTVASLVAVSLIGAEVQSDDPGIAVPASPSASRSVSSKLSPEAVAEGQRILADPTTWMQQQWDTVSRAYCTKNPALLREVYAPDSTLLPTLEAAASNGRCVHPRVTKTEPWPSNNVASGEVGFYTTDEGWSGPGHEWSTHVVYRTGRWLILNNK
jgi:hypothetical protein